MPRPKSPVLTPVRYHFPDPFAGHLVEGVEDPRQTGTPASSAGKRNGGAISTEVSRNRHGFSGNNGYGRRKSRPVEIADFENITRVRVLAFPVLRGKLQVVGDIEFFSGPPIPQAHSVDSHDFFRSELGITSDNYDIGARVVVNNFTDQLPAFFFGGISVTLQVLITKISAPSLSATVSVPSFFQGCA